MATLSEHVAAITAAIKAAEDDGFRVDVDLTYDPYDSGIVSKIELDLWKGSDWENIWTEDRS
jgi:hypothetical protein